MVRPVTVIAAVTIRMWSLIVKECCTGDGAVDRVSVICEGIKVDIGVFRPTVLHKFLDRKHNTVKQHFHFIDLAESTATEVSFEVYVFSEVGFLLPGELC